MCDVLSGGFSEQFWDQCGGLAPAVGMEQATQCRHLGIPKVIGRNLDIANLSGKLVPNLDHKNVQLPLRENDGEEQKHVRSLSRELRSVKSKMDVCRQDQ